MLTEVPYQSSVTTFSSGLRLVAVQTPQAFLLPSLRDAYAGDLTGATDCASLVEARGARVTWVEGDPRLLKVTTRADLEQVAAWL